MQHKKLTIGLFGFGVVGEGVYKVLQQSPSLQATIKKVCIRNPNKKRNAPDDLFTTDKELLLEDPAINIIVEVIDDADAAYKIVRTALLNGKAVVRNEATSAADTHVADGADTGNAGRSKRLVHFNTLIK